MKILDMPKNTIAIRREDLSKTGERRAAVTPEFVAALVQDGHHVLVQPKDHPVTGAEKRAFADAEYKAAGAVVTEDLGGAKVIFGLKEIAPEHILPERTYLCFSHTHKGQKKNRAMLKEFVQRKTTLIDYELVTDAKGLRIFTAFTYFAGYAGMIESFWALGERLRREGHDHILSTIPQSIALQNLERFRGLVAAAGEHIYEHGTPMDLPPLITVFLGDGKTSKGAQEIFDLLPYQDITIAQLPEIYAHGSRHQAYKLVLGISDMYRLKPGAETSAAAYAGLSRAGKEALYFQHPEQFESNLDVVLPYVTLAMNCVLWNNKFPRLITNGMMESLWLAQPTLKVIGDISCDPEGAVEFSRETWVDAPVYIWHPEQGDLGNGLAGEGVAVMAVTNLPCAFSVDASAQFSKDMEYLLPSIGSADYDSTLEQSGLPEELKKATIVWKGEFTPGYAYMEEYLS